MITYSSCLTSLACLTSPMAWLLIIVILQSIMWWNMRAPSTTSNFVSDESLPVIANHIVAHALIDVCSSIFSCVKHYLHMCIMNKYGDIYIHLLFICVFRIVHYSVVHFMAITVIGNVKFVYKWCTCGIEIKETGVSLGRRSVASQRTAILLLQLWQGSQVCVKIFTRLSPTASII